MEPIRARRSLNGHNEPIATEIAEPVANEKFTASF